MDHPKPLITSGAAFADQRGSYDALKDAWCGVLRAIGARTGAIPGTWHVGGRVKGTFSFAEKALRKSGKYRHPHEQVTDLTGVRLVLPTCEEADAAIAMLLDLEREGAILIDWANSFLREQRMQPNQFDYRATHLVAALNRPEVLGVAVPPEALAPDGRARVRSEEEVFQQQKARFVFPVELQVRSALEDLWANETHDRLYKREGAVPPSVQRLSSELAAVLEMADRLILQIRDRVEGLQSSQLALMPKDKIVAELDYWRAVAESWGPGAPAGEWRALHGRMAKLHEALGETRELEALLRPYGDAANVTPDTAPLAREYAEALVRLKGREAEAEALLRAITMVTPGDAEAWCELGDVLLHRHDGAGAVEAYRQARKAAPSSVRALRSFVVARSARGEEFRCEFLEDEVREGIRLGEEQAAAGLNCPQVFFDLGILEVFQHVEDFDSERGMELRARSLDGFLRGIASIHCDASLLEAERQIDLLLAIPSKDTPRQTHLRMLRAVVQLGRIAFLHRIDPASAVAEARKCLAELRKADPPLLFKSLKARAEAERNALLDRAFPDWNSPPEKAPIDPARLPKVRIFAGVTDDERARDLALTQRFGRSVAHFLRTFEGVLVAPGTGVGVGELADVVPPDQTFRITWLAFIPGAHRAAEGYGTIPTPGPEWSFAEPVLMWMLLFASGQDPRNVRLLGIDGGPISEFEYKLCAVLGGWAALVFQGHPQNPRQEDKDRAVERTIRDPFWLRHRGILPMPSHEAAIAAFLEDPLAHPGARSMTKEDLEAGAKALHEAYRAKKLGDARQSIDQNVRAWDLLDESHRQSNREALRAVPWKDDFAKMLAQDGADYAEAFHFAEHGRWVVEKLMAGFRYGPKDPTHRMQLVAWEHLPEKERELDRAQTEAVQEYLRKLRERKADQGASA